MTQYKTVVAEQLPLPGYSSEYCVSIDPGKTTGLALFDFTNRTLFLAFAPMDRIETVLDHFWSIAPFRHYAIERWFLYPNAARKLTFSDMEGPEAIGMARLWGNRHGLTLTRIVASHRRPYLDKVPANIRRPHLRDATAIGLTYLDREKGFIPELSSWKLVYCLLNGDPEVTMKEELPKLVKGES